MIDLSKVVQCLQLSHRAQGKSFSLAVSAGCQGTVKNLKERPGDTVSPSRVGVQLEGMGCAQAQHPVMTLTYEMRLSPNLAKRLVQELRKASLKGDHFFGD